MPPSTVGCAVCGEPGLVCKGCQSTRYCSREHQKQDWEQHRLQCGHPFEVRTNPTLGRHLVATRHIAEGEVVFKEEPLVFGPDSGDSVFSPGTFEACCTSCCRVLDPNLSVWVRCSRCELPMCSAACQDSPVHVPECLVFMRRRMLAGHISDFAMMEHVGRMIFLIRCLRSDKKTAGKIEELQGHSSDSLNLSASQKLFRESEVNLISKTIGTSDFSADDVSRVQAVVDTNRFQVATGRVNIRACALYYFASFMSHSCVPNVEWGLSNDKSMEIVVRAMQSIRARDTITAAYISLDRITAERKRLLLDDKAFECSCERCEDPTECGSYIGSICCEKCKRKGRMALLVGRQRMDDYSVKWRCRACKAAVRLEEVYRYLDSPKKMKYEKHVDNDSIIAAMLYPRGRLHPGSSMILFLKFEMVLKIMRDLRSSSSGGGGCRIVGGEFIPPSQDLAKAVSLCRDLLTGYVHIFPALSLRVGMILLDLHTAMAELLRRRMHHYMSARVDTAATAATAGGNEGNKESAEIVKDLAAAEVELQKAQNALEYLADYKEDLKKLHHDMFIMQRVWVWASVALQFCNSK